MTIQEIADSVLKHLPEEVKVKIPGDVWERIFHRSSLLAFENIKKQQAKSKKTAPNRSSRHPVVLASSSDCDAVDEIISTPPSSAPPKTMEDEDAELEPNRDHQGACVKKAVRFNFVQVRYYERVLDNNPAVSSGFAIGIGWRYKRGGQISVEDWELQRCDEHRLLLTPNVCWLRILTTVVDGC
jgi:hypothetical protein